VIQAQDDRQRREVIHDEFGRRHFWTNHGAAAEFGADQQRPGAAEAVTRQHATDRAAADRPVALGAPKLRHASGFEAERKAVAIGLSADEIRIRVDPERAVAIDGIDCLLERPNFTLDRESALGGARKTPAGREVERAWIARSRRAPLELLESRLSRLGRRATDAFEQVLSHVAEGFVIDEPARLLGGHDPLDV
jgi:hypothetical protein